MPDDFRNQWRAIAFFERMNPDAAPLKKTLIAIVSIIAFAGTAAAQDGIPLGDAQRIARKFVATVEAFNEQPFTVEADGDKPSGVKGGEAGVIVVPDKRLSAESFAKAGKEYTPVGQFWARKVMLVTGGRPVASDKLRIATMGDGERSSEVQFFLLGMAKNEKGEPELLVFGKGKEPLFRVPLEKRSEVKQELPIEVSGRGAGEGSAVLTLNLLGRYTAELEIQKSGE